MGRISASTGLISGLKTQEIIDSLIEVESKVIKQVSDRMATTKTQTTALIGLSASLLSLQIGAGSMRNDSVVKARTASSSNTAVLKATAATGAALGAYQFRAIKLAQTQQLFSGGFATADATPVGAGELKIKLGGFLAIATPLERLNGGLGISRGRISIQDRSGKTATVDLTAARTVTDVVDAINNASGISVKASISGDRLTLADTSGATTSNLAVSESGGGTTAADLGLLGSVAASTLTGTDVAKLAATSKLSHLNDGNGVGNATGVADFRIALRDGTTLDVDLATSKTIQDALDKINLHASNGGKLTASVAGDGKRLTLTDNTGGGGTLSVTSLNQSSAAADLGILGNGSGATLNGKRVISGLNTVLLRNLRGGAGIVTPGSVQFTNRAGATATVDFSSAVTIDDIVSGIDGAGLSLKASVNPAGDGIQIIDQTGASASNLIVADVAAGTTAANLGLVANVAATKIDSGELNLKYIAEGTSLDKLAGGTGIPKGKIRIVNSANVASIVDLTGADKTTVGDVIYAINSQGIGVTARINDTGDGILLTDTAGGALQLTVGDYEGQPATALRLAGSGDGKIDGAYRFKVAVGAGDSLKTVIQAINASGAPVVASQLNDGGGATPYRLLLTSKNSGEAGRVVFNAGATGLATSTLQGGVDAVLGFGTGTFGGANVLLTSRDNTFKDAAPGINVTLADVSASPIVVSVTQSSSSLEATLSQFAAGVSKLLSSIDEMTSFNVDTNARAILQGDSTVLAVQSTLLNAISSTGGPASSGIRSFAQLGLTVAGGRVSFDAATLQAKMQADPNAVAEFLANAADGAARKLESAIKRLTDAGTGLLTQRVDVLRGRTEQQDKRIDYLTSQLDRKRSRLQKQFVNLELALAKVQSNNTAVNQLANLAQYITGGGSSSNRSG